MLNFSRPTEPANQDSLVWAFHGRNLVSELMGSQGAPIRLHNLQADFDEVKDLTSVGYLGDQPVYACTVEVAEIDVMKYMSGNLFALLGRTSQAHFDVIGRAYQLLNWERDHRHCGRCGSCLLYTSPSPRD